MVILQNGYLIRCLYVLVGTFQAAGVIQAAYNVNNELRMLSISAPAECPHDSCSFVTVSSPAVIVEALKQVLVADVRIVLTFFFKVV